MICSTYLEEIAERVRDLIQRSEVASRNLSEDHFNWHPSADLWSIGQIYDHMNIVNRAYVPNMDHAIEFGKYGGNAEMKHSVFGKMIIPFAGPGGNAPVAAKMKPSEAKISPDVAQLFKDDMERFLGFAKIAEDLNLTKTKLKNPFVPVMPLNLADGFELIAAHGERHVGQIEQMLRRSDFPE